MVLYVQSVVRVAGGERGGTGRECGVFNRIITPPHPIPFGYFGSSSIRGSSHGYHVFSLDDHRGEGLFDSSGPLAA